MSPSFENSRQPFFHLSRLGINKILSVESHREQMYAHISLRSGQSGSVLVDSNGRFLGIASG